MNNYIIKESNSEEAELIVDRLVKYNLSKVPGKQEVPLLWINRVIEDTNGEIIAGILSEMYCWNCIYIYALWVKEEYRKNRLGTRLLKEVEKIAKRKRLPLNSFRYF